MFKEIFFEPNRSKAVIIAEVGVNHNGNLDQAVALIEEAVKAGANAVKFQAFIPEEMVLPGTGKASYQQEQDYGGEEQFQMLKRLCLSKEDFQVLSRKAADRRTLFLASVFDQKSALMLRDLKMEVFKIPSGEITNLPLITEVASYGMPLMISTGMATLGEVEDAVNTAFETGNRQVILLHCTSSYPAPYPSLNLHAIDTLKKAFQLPVGYSDHAEGVESAIAAVALGATVLEKHFTLDKNLPGPDHKASLNPDEFRQMVESVRKTEIALGTGQKVVTRVEQELRNLSRKSIVTARTIEQNSIMTVEMLTFKRPGVGLSPKHLSYFIGKRSVRTIPSGTPVSWNDVAPERKIE